MLEAINGLFASKKFIMAILSLIAWIVARKGYQMDVDETMTLISPLIAAIIGQGIADVNKGKVVPDVVVLQTELANLKVQLEDFRKRYSVDAQSGQGGFFAAPLAFALGTLAMLVFGACMLQACGAFKSGARAVADSVVDCTKGEVAKTVGELGPVVDVLLVQSVADGKVSWDPVKDIARRFTADVGGCVLADAVARALHPSPPDPAAPKLSPVEVDPLSLSAGFRQLSVELFGGKGFKTAHGDL